VTIVGKPGALISGVGSAVLDVVSGAVFIRNVKIGPSATIGMAARKDATLLVSKVTIDGNQGGGLLIDGAAFNFSNSTVSNNGPGQIGSTAWGGIFVRAVTSSGGDGTIDHLSVVNNKQIGVTCADGVFGNAIFAAGNAGGIQVASTCGLWTPCAAPGPTCGAQ